MTAAYLGTVDRGMWAKTGEEKNSFDRLNTWPRQGKFPDLAGS